MSAPATILVDASGNLRFLYDDALRNLMDFGEPLIERASHVEPFGDKWTADMSPVDGPVLGLFVTREEALNAEQDWLLDRRLPIPKEVSLEQ